MVKTPLALTLPPTPRMLTWSPVLRPWLVLLMTMGVPEAFRTAPVRVAAAPVALAIEPDRLVLIRADTVPATLALATKISLAPLPSRSRRVTATGLAPAAKVIGLVNEGVAPPGFWKTRTWPPLAAVVR